MLVETTAAVVAPAPGLDDLCPLVPAACVLKADDVVQSVNPFMAFWDAFFVSSPLESVQSAIALILSVPRPDFGAAWFQDAYRNNMWYFGLGIMVLATIFRLIVIAVKGQQDITIVGVVTNVFTSLLQTSFMPVFSGLILWASALIVQYLFFWSNIEKPEDFTRFIDAGYVEIGWMNLVIRLTSSVLLLVVVGAYILQVLWTLVSPLIIPVRDTSFGSAQYVRMVRGILLGFAPAVMALPIALIVKVIDKLEPTGSIAFFQFVGAEIALFGAIYLTIKAHRKSEKYVVKFASRLAMANFGLSNIDAQSSQVEVAYARNVQKRMERRREIKNIVGDLTKVGIAAFTGGAGAAAFAATTGTHSKAGNKMGRAFVRGANMRATVKKVTRRGQVD